MDKASVVCEGSDVLIVACGEMVRPAKEAAELLEAKGISATVLDMYCVKPFDEATFLEKVKDVSLVVTAEEHSPYGGLGSITAMSLAKNCPKKAMILSLPDAPVVTGTSEEVYGYYGLTGFDIAQRVIIAL